jgi:hypothetical protein
VSRRECGEPSEAISSNPPDSDVKPAATPVFSAKAIFSWVSNLGITHSRSILLGGACHPRHASERAKLQHVVWITQS